MMLSALQLPAELWLQVFSYLSWRDLLSLRGSCCHFLRLLDTSCQLWRGFCVTLRDFRRYNRWFWTSLAQRNVGSVCVRAGKRKHLKQLSTWLPALHALRLDDWRDGTAHELKLFHRLRRLSVTSCFTPLESLDFLLPVSGHLTQLSLCNVQLTCPAAHLAAAISQLTRLTSLRLHHDGSLRAPELSGVLTHLKHLTHLSWTMITYRTLSHDFFSSAHLTDELHLSELQLLNYDATVTQEVLQPLSRLRSLSIFHLYSVPGPICHLRTWLTSLPHLESLSVDGGHPLAAYADLLPSSLVSLTLSVELKPEDLQVVSLRAPRLQQLQLEPWSSSSGLVKLLPHLFPHLTTLRIRHVHVPDEDFLSLQRLRRLRTLEVLDRSPRLPQLTSDLHRLTNHRVRVLTSSHRDLLACPCV